MTINDIARICGVSKGTVNRAIHNKTGINAETKARILSKIDELGYRPDYQAKSLATGKTHTIGLILPNLENRFFSTVVTQLEHELWIRGYLLNLALSNDDAKKEERYLELFLDRKIDGLAIFPVNKKDKSLRDYIDSGIPTVVLLNDLPNIDVEAILLDERKAMAALTDHITSLGHRKIAYIDGFHYDKENYNDYINRERYSGFMDSITHAGIDPESISYVDFDPSYYLQDGLGPVKKILKEEGVTAIVCFHDRIAIWLLEQLKQAGIRVPQDISIVGFDDINELRNIKPGITTIRNPYDLIAKKLVTTLLNKIDGSSDANRKVILSSELVVRESCRAIIDPN